MSRGFTANDKYRVSARLMLNESWIKIPTALHFYVDDTVMYCAGSSIKEAVVKLQAVFNIIQTQLSEIKLLLNVDKTKVMLFSKAVDHFGYCYCARKSTQSGYLL